MRYVDKDRNTLKHGPGVALCYQENEHFNWTLLLGDLDSNLELTGLGFKYSFFIEMPRKPPAIDLKRLNSHNLDWQKDLLSGFNPGSL